MNVVIINHSDTRGGASVVSLRLLNALRDAGVDAHMLVVHKASDNPAVVQVGPAWRAKAAFLAEHLRIFAANGFSRADLFKASIATDGLPLHRHPLVRRADAVLLGWVNQGMLSLAEIERIAAMGKRIIWTMHDMWNMTGICHHAGECNCERYRSEPGCGCCPLLHRPQRLHDLSRSTWERKQRLYARVAVRFVAISAWQLANCRSSSLMRDASIAVIPNAFPVEDFSITPITTRTELGLPEGKKIILMGAARIDTPVKGLPLAIEALNKLGERSDAVAVFFGALRNPAALDGLKFPHIHFGPVADAVTLRELYAHASVVLSSSSYETLPTTLIEGQAAGCTPVSFDSSGQTDIIRHRDTGYLARSFDTDDLAAGLAFALDTPIEPEHLRRNVIEKFSSPAIARRYIELINEQ